ncbi:hypothetical protein [Streptomyces cucumeris]|uniref:hypothetical protein n=1 Tax=Streptomyces cucumeris TaxID=2962890 RepID=UPI0020C90C02|nr:hypothetical protein [Streptomyces sp. NEAU-Y11]MCP9213276.1 hypothetical protein [Streptomyces sp. NEAU-Y11]
MEQEMIHEQLMASAQRWAQTAVDAYLEEPADQDFAVHHMAVAVEHISKSYLAFITIVLLAPAKPSVDDLLVLGGEEGKTIKGRAGLRTIGGEEAIKRATGLLGNGYKPPTGLTGLREARNGITHMGWGQPPSECRELLASGVTYIDALLAALSKEPSWFWGHHYEACKDLVAQAKTESELRYAAKIRRAQEHFAKTTRRLSDEEKTDLIRSMSAAPLPSPWLLSIPFSCPACQSSAFVSGRDKLGDYGDVWFFPRHFGCRVCGLTLAGQELDLAGIEAQSLSEEPDPDWEPDF